MQYVSDCLSSAQAVSAHYAASLSSCRRAVIERAMKQRMLISTLSCDGAARNAQDCIMDLGYARLCRWPLTFGCGTFSTRIYSEKDIKRKMHRVKRQHVRDSNAWFHVCLMDHNRDHNRDHSQIIVGSSPGHGRIMRGSCI